MRGVLLASVAIGVVVLAPAAFADQIPDCAAPANAAVHVSQHDLPAPIAQDIAAHAGVMAEPTERFNATDLVMKDLPTNRFIRAWASGDLWAVAIERGGLGYHDDLLIYRLKGSQIETFKHETAVPPTLCSLMMASFAQ